jgi:hypothetical protein
MIQLLHKISTVVMIISISLSFCQSNGSLVTLEALQDLTQISYDSLLPNTNCIRAAVSRLLPSCQQTLNAHQRTFYSIQLSVCEFEAAGISYPNYCHSSELDVLHCSQTLESRPQWWTSFSGNYRLVGIICTEHQKDHLSEHTVRLYKNITDLQYKMFQDLRWAYDELQLQTRHNKDAIQASEFLNTSMNVLKAEMNGVVSTMSTHLSRQLEFTDQLDNRLANIYEKLVLVFYSLNERFAELEDRLSNASSISSDLYESGKTVQLLSNLVVESLSGTTNMTMDLEKSVLNSKQLVEQATEKQKALTEDLKTSQAMLHQLTNWWEYWWSRAITALKAMLFLFLAIRFPSNLILLAAIGGWWYLGQTWLWLVLVVYSGWKLSQYQTTSTNKGLLEQYY